jgi:oligopeptide/dipeptide ABC transporter ATP-binding protein
MNIPSGQGNDTAHSDQAPVLQVEGLEKHFPLRKGLLNRATEYVYAVDGVSFHINKGETLGLVGESGCGKSTVGRSILRLIEPSAGAIRMDGQDILPLSRRELHPYRRKMQIIFQDPYSSLNPRMTAGDIVGEPLVVHGIASGQEKQDRVAALFRRVGLRPDQMRKYPHEFSGGQRQRIGIARALSLEPRIIIGDEPVSALDVSIQAQVINLLMELQEELQLAYLFIAHDLSVVEHISHRVAVMYLGRIVELANREDLFLRPQHPYTEALLSAVPLPDPRRVRKSRIVLPGDVPSPVSPPSGCRFHTRCPLAVPRCRTQTPELREVQPNHWAACHLR